MQLRGNVYCAAVKMVHKWQEKLFVLMLQWTKRLEI
jgi:hypothetical protein